jgi:formylglycine-generating enzyme required for sulfatase activity
VQNNLKDGLNYVWIPPDDFQMGCSDGDKECDTDEHPAHRVRISNGFWLGQTPVTQAAYQRVMHSNPSHFHGDQLPVETVSWNEAKGYCETVGGRLPTEAEWEYAARAGTTTARYGDLNTIGWYDKNSRGKTREVGRRRANGWGLYDMLGNVWEWVNDWYDADYYKNSTSEDPKGPMEQKKYRVIRGGSWHSGSRVLRSSYRFRIGSSFSLNVVGFRCAREVFP